MLLSACGAIRLLLEREIKVLRADDTRKTDFAPRRATMPARLPDIIEQNGQEIVATQLEL